MFTGIIECASRVLRAEKAPEMIRLSIEKPKSFDDLTIGDSIAVDGVCLTVEKFDDESMEFVVAAETLQVTKWTSEYLSGREVNLERSLRFGDRVHGHLVTGHVDAQTVVLAKDEREDSIYFEIATPQVLDSFLWRKGSIALNGVSLTVNDVTEKGFSVLLIPETLRRTNLANLNVDSLLNIEGDYFAKGFMKFMAARTTKEGAPEWKA